jgi:hypothetical protein
MQLLIKVNFIELTRKMIYNKEYHNEDLVISERLLTQFDKSSIRERLITIYIRLVNDLESSSVSGKLLPELKV